MLLKTLSIVFREYGEAVRVPAMGERLTHYLPGLSREMHPMINTLFYIAFEPEDVGGWLGVRVCFSGQLRFCAAQQG